MPVVDWCRTDLEWELPNGAKAMRFDQDRFAAFDLHILQRPEAPAEYSEGRAARAKQVYSRMTQADIDYLVTNIASALPGSTTDPLTIPQFRDRLQQYRGINSAVLRQHLIEFLARVTPVAEALGVTLTLHPDDPPRPLFGLPRIASSAEDYQALFDAVPSKANGICFCTGSLGVRAENDLPAMAKRFAPRIGFAHLRATKREGDGLSFFESDHLDGDVDMIAVLKALLAENRKRSSRTTRSCSGPITAIACSTISRKPSAPIPAIPRSAGCAAWPNCAAPSAPSNTPADLLFTRHPVLRISLALALTFCPLLSNR